MLARVSAAFALAWAGTSMVVGPGGAALVRLTGDERAAGAFVALFYVGAALGSWLGGHLMDRHGRKPVVLEGYVLAAAGYALAGIAEAAGQVPLFVPATVALAAGAGALTLGRLAVAEGVEPARRGRALAVLQVSATAGAVAGPLLLVAAPHLPRPGGVAPLDLAWWLGPPLLLAGALLVAGSGAWPRWAPAAAPAAAPVPPAPGAPPPLASAPPAGRAALASPAAPRSTAGLAPAVATLVLVQSAMVAVMGVAGPAVVHEGHGASAIGLVVLAHFAGMFGLSLLAGRFADRHGRVPAILAGWALLALGGLAVAALPGLAGFAAGLLLVGLGWSFAYLGATALFADRAPADRRARILGRTDLAGSLLAAAMSAAGGVVFAQAGLSTLGALAAAVAVVGVALVLRAWPAGQRRPTA